MHSIDVIATLCWYVLLKSLEQVTRPEANDFINWYIRTLHPPWFVDIWRILVSTSNEVYQRYQSSKYSFRHPNIFFIFFYKYLLGDRLNLPILGGITPVVEKSISDPYAIQHHISEYQHHIPSQHKNKNHDLTYLQ